MQQYNQDQFAQQVFDSWNEEAKSGEILPSTRIPEITATRKLLDHLGITYGTFDDKEVVSARELYEALGINGSGVNSTYIPIQYAGIILDVAQKLVEANND